MGLFDEFGKFLEDRLDEFLRDNPHLELQAIEEQVREQEEDTRRLILNLQRQEQQIQDEILAIAKDIELWHKRISKAESSGREDLAQAAKEREAALLRQGNQKWGQMEGVKQNLIKAKELLQQTQQKRKEVQAKAAEAVRSPAQTPPSSSTSGWEGAGAYRSINTGYDPLDDRFRQWEMDEEIEQIKRDIGK
ncbi:TIGR04376 family protein [Spirulina sp. 06S082]|uniref:TIGR04376 family protein n=1 Tax=Spirulina sp. 06S082 TaxID=3110248 RepID=UPI002B210B6C|nr:TIGR04376 family protein [Spirulina sp. 06S082]MEA5468314.1 TIGR04376 family protein [Spirulina sp. 06S082]